MENNNNNMFEEHNKYIERFHNPDFTAYDFLFLFSSIYTSLGEYSFEKDSLIKFIRYCKDNPMFANLLSDINFKNNGISYYSDEFEEAIGKLKFGGILYTISTEKDSTIYIHKDIPFLEIIESKKDYVENLNNFINEYKNFKNDKVNKNTLLLDKNSTTIIMKKIKHQKLNLMFFYFLPSNL